MTQQEEEEMVLTVEQWINDAGLFDVMNVFASAVEIDTHQPHPDGGNWTGYRAMWALRDHLLRELEAEDRNEDE